MGWFEEEHKKRQERIEREKREENDKKEKQEEQSASIKRSTTAKLKIVLERFSNFKREKLINQKEYSCKVDQRGYRDAKGEDYILEAIFYFRTTPLLQGREKLAKKNSPFISIKAEKSGAKLLVKKNMQEVPTSETVRVLRLPVPAIDASVIDEAYVDNLIKEFVVELMAKK